MSRLVFVLLSASLCACLEPPVEAPADVTALVGPAGGRVEVFGTVVEIPPGALNADALIRITRLKTLPRGVPGRAVGDAFLIEPEGQQFGKTVRLALRLNEETSERIFVATAPSNSNTFALLHATHDETTVTTAITHLSIFVPVVLPPDGG